MKQLVTTLVELAGAGLVVAGIGAFSVPIAMIVAGLLLIAGGFAAS